MVAFSFKGQFAEPILAGTKRQTVRAFGSCNWPKAGHALQLYTGMRTKQCRKIRPDVTCTEVCMIEIEVDPQHPEIIAAIKIDGMVLGSRAIERFAIADGFFGLPDAECSARLAMGRFWLRHHGAGPFVGSLVRWEPN